MRTLAPARRTFIEDGVEKVLPDWPREVDGIRFGVLERRGRMLIVRVEFSDQDVILHTAIVLDTVRHLHGGQRPATQVALISDDLAERILDDVFAANPAQTNAIALLVNRVNQVRRASREAASRLAGGGTRTGG